MAGLRRTTVLGLSFALWACTSAGAGPKALDSLIPKKTAYAIEEPIDAAAAAEPLIVAAEVTEGFEFMYQFVSETEFVLCLEGSRQDGKIVVDGFRLARIESTTPNNVRYKPCTSTRYIGTAHNHPPVPDSDASLCYQSTPDRRSFANDTRAEIDIVLCGKNRFLWALKDGRRAVRRFGLE